MLECALSPEAAEVYPAVNECELVVALVGWTAEDLDITGLLRPVEVRRGRYRGVLPPVVCEPDPGAPITPWGVIRPFMERVLGDAGHLEYEQMLDLFEANNGVEVSLKEYYQQTRK